MSKTRMFTGDEPDAAAEEAGTPSPRTTIVGGRPPEPGAKGPPVPTGLQRLLRLAAVDPAFLERLLERRAAVAEAAGVTLTASETAILEAIPAEQLAQLARILPEPEADRRDFLRRTAATAVVLLGGAVLSTCTGCEQSGDELPPWRPTRRDTSTEGGAAPHEPPPKRPEHVEPATTGGARPDEPPPPRPDRIPSPPGGARPDEPPPPPERTDGGQFAAPPPGWEGGAPDGGQDRPPRPDRPNATRGIRPDWDEEAPPRTIRAPQTKGIRPDPPPDDGAER